MVLLFAFVFLQRNTISHEKNSKNHVVPCSDDETLATEKREFENEKEKFGKEKEKFEKEKEEFQDKKQQFIEENEDFDYAEDPEEEKEKIDVVFTWGGIVKDMNIRNRYNYELQFSLRAVHKYLPWVNKIYVLVNSDTDYPYWINKEAPGKIIVYDRCTIIENPDHCPTSNSFAVFSALHKVEGLADKFILIDDDVFINQPLTPDYFFTEEGFPRVYQTHKKMQIYQDDREFTDIKRPKYKYTRFSHLPKPMRKDLIIKFHAEYPDYAKLVQSHKKRYKKLSEEFSMIYYEYFFEMKWLKAEDKSKAKFYQIPHKHTADITKEFEDIYKELIDKHINTFNCNDDYSTNKETYLKQRKVLWDFYMKLYPETPDYEIPNPDHEKYS
ncbi:hypothetical protein M0812_28697 [Anaeramoeba flamelloides]|uniref:Stealth protein CR2 conserved region 2 domain-containing protein n=1 Tax=Anaeramoeba flamelloides TaxID=1746091 RepID=A0AAV7YBG5_9EUKA|nr:hypothetical protein M0812_28697 [Anaeramoeba flamelloides]